MISVPAGCHSFTASSRDARFLPLALLLLRR